MYLQFGYGDIHFGSIEDHKTGETVGIAFIEGDVREIGEYCAEHKGKTLDKLKTKVIMQFDDVASVDVLLKVLYDTKNKMIDKKDLAE